MYRYEKEPRPKWHKKAGIASLFLAGLIIPASAFAAYIGAIESVGMILVVGLIGLLLAVGLIASGSHWLLSETVTRKIYDPSLIPPAPEPPFKRFVEGKTLVLKANGFFMVEDDSSSPTWLGENSIYNRVPVKDPLSRKFAPDGFKEKFICPGWCLFNDQGSLVYKVEPFPPLRPEKYVSTSFKKHKFDLPLDEWSVEVNDIASVEAGKTTDWQAVRKMDFGWGEAFWHVPDNEWQTYIMDTKGRRLVVHTANSDRETCAALAHSVRGWVEAQRNASIVRDNRAVGEDEGFSL
jgi:hypothetical protein